MFEKSKEYWNKYKKYIIAILILIMGVFLLNFLFVITDWIAGKGFNGCAMIYSPVSNEEWLSFIGNGIVGLATLLLFWIAKKSFENERNKVKYENKKKKIEKEMEVVEEYLSVFEVNNIYKLIGKFLKSYFLESFDSDEEIVENFTLQKEKILKDINFAQLKLDFRTDLRIVLGEKLKSEKYQKEKNERYNELVDLHNMYGIILKDIFNKAGDLIKIQDLEERKLKISLISSSSEKVKSEIKDEFLKIFSKYEKYLKEDLDRNLNGKNLQTEIEYGRFSVIFNVYLNYVINKVKEYFINIEKDIEEELL